MHHSARVMRYSASPRSIRRWLSASLVALLLLWPATALAAHDPKRLAALLEEGRAADAWALAQEHRAVHEGEPRFDFYYGVAAIETGHLGEAVFALRRVLAADPGLDRARAELGRAYFLLGEDLRAREEFEQVLAHDPPAPLRAQVERHLLALDRRAGRYETRVSGFLELGGGHDTNANSASDAETIDTVDGPRVLIDKAREQPDDFARVAGGLRVTRPLIADVNVFGALEGMRRYHDDKTDFEIGRVQARTGAIVRGERTRTTLAARGQRLYVGGDVFRDVGGLDAAFRYSMSEVQVVEAAAGFSRLRHETLEERDSELWRVVGGVTRMWRVPLRPTVAVKAFYGEEDAELDTQEALARSERELYGADATLRLRLAARWVLRSGLEYRRSDYAGVDARFGEARNDEFHEAELVLEWRPGFNWRVQQRLSHAVNDSNLELFEYGRSVAELRIRYEFQ